MSGEIRRFAFPVSLLATLLLFATTAGAQELEKPASRQGYYMSVGAVGNLSFHHLGDDGWTPPEVGPGWDLGIGQGITDRLDLGVRVGTSWVYEEEHRALVGHVSLEGRFHFADNAYLALGAGFGFTDFTRRKKGIDARIGRVSGAYTLTFGYDFFLTKQEGVTSGGVALSPFISVRGGPSDPTSALSALIGISVTWWSGLPKEQLELPLERAFETE